MLRRNIAAKYYTENLMHKYVMFTFNFFPQVINHGMKYCKMLRKE